MVEVLEKERTPEKSYNYDDNNLLAFHDLEAKLNEIHSETLFPWRF